MSTSATAKGIKFLLLALLLSPGLTAASWQNATIHHIVLSSDGQRPDPRLETFRILLPMHPGEPFNSQLARQSIATLYKTGAFADIAVRVSLENDQSVTVYFEMQKKLTVRALRFSASTGIRKRDMARAIFSLRANEYFEEYKVAKSRSELQDFFKSQGYFAAAVTSAITRNEKRGWVDVHFTIDSGEIPLLRKVDLQIDNPEVAARIRSIIGTERFYLPVQFNKKIDRIKRTLNRSRFLFPTITMEEEFLNPALSAVNLKIVISCGHKYVFKFMGMPKRMDLITSVWEKKVFEKWAEQESRTRLLNYLKNEGYLDAEISSNIIVKDSTKYVVFTAIKKTRFHLGRVRFSGNRVIDSSQLTDLIRSDKLFFDKFLWLRSSSLLVDLEILKLFYYYQGFPAVLIDIQPEFRQRQANILFRISEGRRVTVGAILFSDNRFVSSETLSGLMRTKIGLPFVQRQLNEDIDNLQNYLWNNGFDEATVNGEISGGDQKALLVKIHEGTRHQMGELIIIGASPLQRGLIQKLFPLAKGAPFSRLQIDRFQAEIDSSAIFAEFRIEKIDQPDGAIDILIKTTPDHSQNWGFGVGWEDRKGIRSPLEGLRGTFEYQRKNIFNSISTFSAILQIGLNEQRGIVTYDTPYFFKNKINSSFKIWQEDETYPSYRFQRWGLGGSFIKTLSEQLYIIGSLKWYRTVLKELAIPEFGVDRTGIPFDTTALTFSLVKENRDNPFNPSSGDFISAELKVGLPFLEKNYTFIKLFWNYQRHARLLRTGVLSLSVRNGYGFGDMSITERFFAGGSHSFRGAGNDRLGPISSITDEPAGGNVLILANLEATFPVFLIPIDDLYYSLFVDIGNVFNKSSDVNLQNLETALGVSLKYRTPIGPLRLDFAWSLDRGTEKNFRVFIGIGNVY